MLLLRIYLKIRKIIWKKFIHPILNSYYRQKVKSTAVSIGKGLKVNAPTWVTPKTILGNNVNFNGMEMIGNGNIVIGDNFHSGRGCIIITSNHNYDRGKAIPYDTTNIDKDVIIEDNVWLGINVTITGGVTIGEGAIIQIGSVVVSNIPPLAIAGGHPAKVYKYRNKEHYFRLKELKSFI